MNLLIEAFEANLKHEQYDLAMETLNFLPKETANLLRKKLPKAEYKGLAGSIVDWENHLDFGVAGACFLCGKPFSREESKLIGIGPVCGNWSYAFDPKLPENAEKLEKVKRAVRQRLFDGKGKYQYGDIIHLISKLIGHTPIIRIIKNSPKAILVDIDGKISSWIPMKHCVYYFGAFYVRDWKTKEIMNELVRKM